MGIWSTIKGLFEPKREEYRIEGKVLLLSKKEHAIYMAKLEEEREARERQRARDRERLNDLVDGSIFVGDNFTFFPDDDKCGCTVIFEVEGSVQIEHINFKTQYPEYIPTSNFYREEEEPKVVYSDTRFSIARPKESTKEEDAELSAILEKLELVEDRKEYKEIKEHTRFSLAPSDDGTSTWPSKQFPKRDPEEEKKKEELNSKLESFRKMAEELRRMGASEEALASVLAPKQDIGRLLITRDYKIILPKYENKEVMLRPLPKALYLLFLKHPEGIAFKDLADHRDELFDIYNHITARWQYDINAKSIESLTDPTNNSINEKCSRIYKAFVDTVDKTVADKLAIKGKRGEARTIDFDREKVDWE